MFRSDRLDEGDGIGAHNASNVVGTSPELLEMPALSNRITSRVTARPSVTSGSQWSIVPVKCWLKTSGTPPDLPKRQADEPDTGRVDELRRRGLVVVLAHPDSLRRCC